MKWARDMRHESHQYPISRRLPGHPKYLSKYLIMLVLKPCLPTQPNGSLEKGLACSRFVRAAARYGKGKPQTREASRDFIKARQCGSSLAGKTGDYTKTFSLKFAVRRKPNFRSLKRSFGKRSRGNDLGEWMDGWNVVLKRSETCIENLPRLPARPPHKALVLS